VFPYHGQGISAFAFSNEKFASGDRRRASDVEAFLRRPRSDALSERFSEDLNSVESMVYIGAKERNFQRFKFSRGF
jgi:hypothetical protein